MKMIEVKVAEATGRVLDYLVERATAADEYSEQESLEGARAGMLRYSTDWAKGGPLIEKWQIFIDPPHDVHRANYEENTGKVKGCWQTYESWHATVSARVCTRPSKLGPGFPGTVGRGEGATTLIAAMRAIVISILGEKAKVPAELLELGA